MPSFEFEIPTLSDLLDECLTPEFKGERYDPKTGHWIPGTQTGRMVLTATGIQLLRFIQDYMPEIETEKEKEEE